ncbi:MAG: FAD:protein FMN transferase [Pseudomonadota bacterium]
MLMNRKRDGHWFIPFFLVATVLLPIASCDNAPSHQSRLTELNGRTMGTTYTVKIVDLPQSIEQKTLHQKIDAVLVQVNNVMSTYQSDSELSLFNQNQSTDWIDISPELLSVVQAAREISELSNGAFDVTVGPLVNLWGFGPDVNLEDALPAAEKINEVRERVGYQKVELHPSPPAMRKAIPDVYIDLSSIAKGYGVDQIATLLEVSNIQNYLVEVGGELRAHGDNADDLPWRLAIEKPVANERSVQMIIPLSGQSIATSGDYRNYFEKDGQRYSHIIDSTTGKPVTHKLASVTVLHPSSMRADGLATAFLVLGPERAYALANQKNIAALFLIKTANGFEQKATMAFQPYMTE